MKIQFWSLLLILFFHQLSMGSKQPVVTSFSSIRVRLLKDLVIFPELRSAKIKKIYARVWSVEGSQLLFAGKKLADKNFR